jgi:hypothetical protein
VKTAISVPDATFRRVDERAAALGMSRSEFYARAAERYLEELGVDEFVRRANDALARAGAEAKREAKEIGQIGLRRLGELTEDDDW